MLVNFLLVCVSGGGSGKYLPAGNNWIFSLNKGHTWALYHCYIFVYCIFFVYILPYKYKYHKNTSMQQKQYI